MKHPLVVHHLEYAEEHRKEQLSQMSVNVSMRPPRPALQRRTRPRSPPRLVFGQTQGKNRRRSYLVSESDIQSTFSKVRRRWRWRWFYVSSSAVLPRPGVGVVSCLIKHGLSSFPSPPSPHPPPRPVQVKWPSIWVMLVFTVTLAIFPGLAVEVVSATPKSTWGSTYFVPVYVFVLFNLGDTLGRYLVAHFKWPSFAHYRWLRFPVYLRAVFIVLFIFCNLNVSKTVCRRGRGKGGAREQDEGGERAR